MEYIQALKVIGKRDSKKVGNNTYMIRLGSDIGIRLHNTVVVTIHPDNTYTLNSGGWQTVTTKDRINQYSPIRVYQSKSIWYVGQGEPFYDNMKVGVVCGEPLALGIVP